MPGSSREAAKPPPPEGLSGGLHQEPPRRKVLRRSQMEHNSTKLTRILRNELRRIQEIMEEGLPLVKIRQRIPPRVRTLVLQGQDLPLRRSLSFSLGTGRAA